MYFPDIELTADIAADHRPGFTGWRVNGRLIPGAAPLKFKADQPTQIEAVFNNNVHTLARRCRVDVCGSNSSAGCASGVANDSRWRIVDGLRSRR